MCTTAPAGLGGACASPERIALALTGEQLFLAYQPVVELGTERIVGAEALLRWNHPEGGVVPPGEFLPAAERAGLLHDIGCWSLGSACRQLRRWLEDGLAVGTVAVNLAVSQLAEPGFAAGLLRLVEDLDLPPYQLELELTESTLLAEADGVRAAIRRLSACGVRFALDDFGTGYSSLRALQTLPVHRLKIARDFVHDVAGSAADAAIVGAVVDLGHRLGMTVLAEGVERAEQVAALKSLGCDEAQGFYFSRPLPPADFAARLDSAGPT
jgi:EAL domain-containing protein (putative c-di-GMP-specific phosphodiesterase class I)